MIIDGDGAQVHCPWKEKTRLEEIIRKSNEESDSINE